ncbi:MAG: 1-(5-phosphoribosyl)-5-[(5-phosphoribosylamino)methylideneamino]imidazole-4-carboxamide isomerase [Actinobacteria bacterium]|nr:MAG: 1-(5-phosphoribosyl)-5-[(5-phosphoribosylamino)methylideneamino]imidazole-4-carboxamide isomerase [Actinomycetota bacterium]
MNLYPAIDIISGKTVRLARGDFAEQTVYGEDPLGAARAFVDAGARFLHVVDLDGARTGEPVNLEHLRRICSALDARVQYGGGLRSLQAVEDALRAGAARVILGTAAFTDDALLRDAIAAHGPERVAVSVDVRAGRVATHGWLQTSEAPAREAFTRLRKKGVRDFIFTSIDHDGMLDGASREEAIWVAKAAGDGSVIYAGGIGELSDLEQLARLRAHHQLRSLAGVIVGKALHERRFTIEQAQAVLSG